MVERYQTSKETYWVSKKDLLRAKRDLLIDLKRVKRDLLMMYQKRPTNGVTKETYIPERRAW